MPIKHMTASPAPGQLIQICAACGAEHTISFDRGAQKSRTGPVALAVNDTLVVRVDGGAPATVTFAAGDFPDFTNITAAELATKLDATLPGARALDDAGGLLLESQTTGEASRIEIVDGTARAALGFAVDRTDPCVSRPVLGISYSAGQMRDPNILMLRRCNDCGATECLVRTLDGAPRELEGTHFAEHRRAVNALAQHCKACGWSHPDVVDHHAAETVRPLDIDSEFPHRPTRLPGIACAKPRRNTQATEEDRDEDR
jgi:hypothetical protein